MIVKEKTTAAPGDKFGQAGHRAEQQMAFYLRRAFAEAGDVLVFNDLRLERNGEYAQMDHLVLHRFGFVIVESKSVVGELVVNGKGEFTRKFEGRSRGIQSPIRQAQLQAELLTKLVNDHKESLRRKVFGTRQAYFREGRFRVLVAISDQGIIRREGCDPEELSKADTVTDKIRSVIAAHVKARSVGGTLKLLVATGEAARRLEKDDLMPLTDEELAGLQAFLLQRHVPLSAAPAAAPPVVAKPKPWAAVAAEDRRSRASAEPAALNQARCRHCSGDKLLIRHGRYGYYYKCPDCDGNTPTDSVCTACGAKARVKKSGREFSRVCEKCGTQILFHVNCDVAEE